MRLQSVELRVPDVAATAQFFAEVWGLVPVSATRLRGSDADPHLIELAPGKPAILGITFSGSPAEVSSARTAKGPEGATYRFVTEAPAAPLAAHGDRPVRLSHVVLNSIDADAAERFAVDSLGFKVSDRTRHMNFVRCERKHHCLAFARAGVSSLNHIAFDMPDVDAVMRGIGRLRDAGYPCVWGPGRHGPGNNVFAYFIGPHGGIVEYTAEVQEVGDDYRVGRPEDWKWPPGRIDQWGVSAKDTAKTDPAERAFTWPDRSPG